MSCKIRCCTSGWSTAFRELCSAPKAQFLTLLKGGGFKIAPLFFSHNMGKAFSSVARVTSFLWLTVLGNGIFWK